MTPADSMAVHIDIAYKAHVEIWQIFCFLAKRQGAGAIQDASRDL
jgi:hypothetical protein